MNPVTNELPFRKRMYALLLCYVVRYDCCVRILSFQVASTIYCPCLIMASFVTDTIITGEVFDV